MPSDAPPDRVLDLFAAEGVLEPLAGGQGTTWRAGDLVLSPADGSAQLAWLAPVQARLAVRLDEEVPRSLRLALPVPARDGRLVVDGWAAARFEPRTTQCRDLATLRATAHLLHARLATVVPARPVELDARTDQWAVAERLAYDGAAAARAARVGPSRGSPGSSRPSSPVSTTPTSAASRSSTPTSRATCSSTRPPYLS